MTTGDQPQAPTKPQRRAVNRIFATFKTAYPSWYEKHFGDERAEALGKRVWLFVTERLSEAQIDTGLQRLVAEAKYPVSPAEFVAMSLVCDGVPSLAEAWMQALRGSYTHEVVRVAAKLTGTYTLARSRPSDRVVQKQFEYHYAIVMRRFQNGEPLGGAVARAVGHDSQKSEAQLADEYADQLVRKRIEAQGVPQDPQAARVAMLARLGIKREGQGAGHGHA